ncbi:hypothetical protein BcepSauron_047 [Burkholderia phage BcepSauron]|uniref:Uncharacterized protein n=2 Tax=Sarumanvirus TaxID=2843450 RepID=A0A482MK71_9CAUD|nr:hypothetical protein H1O16_gp046 [Burkholderia phage BcepSaruman]YP_009904425.1 hypothetical protein H1O17_gp047 [Burkholderia phage BcepSauron]QBQ74427.1 hypothetical protein BcepSauron_047 [Burkholderia phage BcepSauron]QBX06459.1 hypothetical protein BcepSaruman_046 [Burkholderia phage BcepSaruman]
MNKTNIRAYSQIIAKSALNRQVALQCEIAVGFAVILDSYPSRRLARAQLQKIFFDAGYKCDTPAGIDWKTVNRRIAGAIMLFDFLGEEDVRSWAGDLQKQALVDALIKKIEPLKLKTLNELVTVCKGSRERAPGGGRKPGIRFDTAHMHVTVPPSAAPEELLEIAGKLMSLAQEIVNARNVQAQAQAQAAGAAEAAAPEREKKAA